jgi:predicted transcriptional regulator with HTH domain
MTVRDKMIAVTEKYCEMHGIKREDLFQKHKHSKAKKKKVVNGVNVSQLRMALGFYLYKNFPASLTEVAHIVGYEDHSSISGSFKKIYFYIKNEDAYFMRFYKPLEEVGQLYEPVKFDRITSNQYALLK